MSCSSLRPFNPRALAGFSRTSVSTMPLRVRVGRTACLALEGRLAQGRSGGDGIITPLQTPRAGND